MSQIPFQILLVLTKIPLIKELKDIFSPFKGLKGLATLFPT